MTESGGHIYVAENTQNGKVYVGQTTGDLRQRINQHSSGVQRRVCPSAAPCVRTDVMDTMSNWEARKGAALMPT